jgi:hypothetical protein
MRNVDRAINHDRKCENIWSMPNKKKLQKRARIWNRHNLPIWLSMSYSFESIHAVALDLLQQKSTNVHCHV